MELAGTFEPGSPEWHALRATGIGASEAAAVLGLSPWESPYSLWQRKAGRIGPMPESEEMTWGHYLEEPIARRFADLHPSLTVERTGTWRSTELPWQLVNPDRLAVGLDDGVVPVEVKFAPYGREFGDSGTEDIPLHYRAQILQQCDVLDAPYGWLVALVGADYREYRIDADPLDIAVLRERCGRFWASLPTENNPAGHPPAIDESGHTFRALKELHPDIDDIDHEVNPVLAARIRDAQFFAKEAGDGLLQVKNELLDAMGRARRARYGGESVATRYVSRGALALRLTPLPKPTGSTLTEHL
jgi:putative phage-type endonuclease